MFRLRRGFASARDPDPAAAALEALARRDFARAEALLSELVAAPGTAGERAFLLNKRGVARVGLSRIDAARDDFLAALLEVTRYAPALTNLGNLALEAGDAETAIARYEEAITADPQYALAHFNLGNAYKRAGRFDEGVRELRTAQRLEKVRVSDAFGRRRR